MKKLITLLTASSIAMTSVAPAFATSLPSWEEVIANHTARVAADEFSGYTLGKHSNAVFKPLAGRDGFLFGNVIADDVPLPRVTDITKVLNAAKQGEKPIIVASQKWLLPSNPMLCEIARQVKMDCAEFTRLFYRYMAQNDDGSYAGDEAADQTLDEIQAELVTTLESMDIEVITEPGFDWEAYAEDLTEQLNEKIAYLQDKDAQITDLKAAVADRNETITSLKAGIQAKIDELAAVRTEMQNEIDRLEGINILHQVNIAVQKETIKNLKADKDELQEQINDLVAARDALEIDYNNEVTAHDATKAELNAAIADLQQQIEDAKAEAKKYKEWWLARKAEAIEQTALAEEYHGYWQSWKKKAIDLEGEKTELEKAKAELESDLADEITAHADTQTDLDSLKADYNAQTTALNKANEKIKELEGKYEAALNSAVTWANKWLETSNELATTKTELATAKSDLADTQADLTAAETKISTLKGTIDTLNGTIGDHEATIHSLNAIINDEETGIEALKADISTLEEQVGTLESIKTELGNTITSLKAEISQYVGHFDEITETLGMPEGTLYNLLNPEIKKQIAGYEAGYKAGKDETLANLYADNKTYFAGMTTKYDKSIGNMRKDLADLHWLAIGAGTWKGNWDNADLAANSDATIETNSFINGWTINGHDYALTGLAGGQIHDLIKEAYDDGYDDGYSAGYKAGWNDAIDYANTKIDNAAK